MTWNTVDVTLVDPVNPDMAQVLIENIRQAGYPLPALDQDPMLTEAQAAQTTIGKARAQTALGQVSIAQIGPPSGDAGNDGGYPDGADIEVESWTLHNPWIKDVKFGELSYESEELSEITVTFRYDYAMLRQASLNPHGLLPSPKSGG